MAFILEIFLIISSFFVSEITYNLENTYTFENVLIEYGNLSAENHIDGYIKIYDKETNDLVEEVTYDSGGYDLFKYLAIVGKDTYIIVCDTYYFNLDYKYPIYRSSVLLKYNVSGELLLEYPIDYKPNSYNNHNNLLILTHNNNQIIYNKNFDILESIEIPSEVTGDFHYQFQGDATINKVAVDEIFIDYPGNYEIEVYNGDYVFSFNIIVHPDIKIIGNEYSGGYLGSVSIYGFGELFLNNETYNIGTEITQVGNYDLVVNGVNNYYSTLSFIILPDVIYHSGSVQDQLIEGQEFSETIKIFSNAQSMFLNGEIYSSDLIDSTGEYSLTLYGINGFEENISFLLIPKVDGVEDGQIYDVVEINLFGEALLNGKKISGDYTINENGEYLLELLLNEKVVETVKFTIVNTAENQNNKTDFAPYLKYIFLFISLLGGVLILRKK